METKFTPGEWRAELVGVSSAGPEGENVYEITNGHQRIAEYVAECDAPLLAAARELLALLIESQESIGGDWRERRDALIAKATGSAA